MIARIWSAHANRAAAPDYAHHFSTAVAPALRRIPGHRGAYLLQREADDGVEFVALTLWDTLDTITRFAGPDPTVAIVEPEGRAALTRFDATAKHYQVVEVPPPFPPPHAGEG